LSTKNREEEEEEEEERRRKRTKAAKLQLHSDCTRIAVQTSNSETREERQQATTTLPMTRE
jgi:hypothetical protein